MLSQHLGPDSPFKCNAKYKADFCSRLQTPEGFAVVSQRPASQVAGSGSGDLKESTGFCGVSGDEIRLRLCKRADEQEQLDFLASSCLGYARANGAPTARPADSFGSVIVARECAGRTFSSPPAQQYRNFCGAASRQKLMQPVTADAGNTGANTAPQEEKKEDVATRGKKLLKDIFNR
jgi:hypothetical protein